MATTFQNALGVDIPSTSTSLSGLLTGAGQLGSAVLPYTLSEGEIGDLKKLGTTLGNRATEIATGSAEQAAFQPFAVKTSTGSNTQLNPLLTDQGLIPQLTTTLGTTEQQIQDQLLTDVNALAKVDPTTAQSLYDQIRAIQMPEEDRQRLAMQNSLFNQGRSGVQTAAYGGTPEQLAFQKAIQESQNAAAFQSAQLAPQLQGQNIGNITGMLGAAYLPQNQAMASMQPALEMSRLAQMAAQGQSEALFKGGIAGLEAEAAANTAAANVEAARTQALANSLSGMFARPDSGGASSGESFFSNLLGYFEPAKTFADSSGITGTVDANGMLISNKIKRNVPTGFADYS